MNEWDRLHRMVEYYKTEYPSGTRIMLKVKQSLTFEYLGEDMHRVEDGRSLSVAGTGIGMNALRLLQQTSQILQNEVRPVYQDRSVDRKLRRKINEKKQAQGLRQ